MILVVMTVEQEIDLAIRDLTIKVNDHQRWIDQCSHIIINEDRVAIGVLSIFLPENYFDPTKTPDFH
jgi:hypothetical protein